RRTSLGRVFAIGVLPGLAGLILVLADPVQAATFYVDGNCPASGNGTTITCGTSGPKTSIPEGLALIKPGDTLEVRGIHPPHDGETSAFDGRYFQIEHGITLACTATSPCTLQTYGWTSVGTGETAFLDGTRPPSNSWSRCATCTSGVCAGIPGVCQETWYVTDNGTSPAGFQSGSASEVRFAQKADGSITYRVLSKVDLTNAHSEYSSQRCSTSLWKPCKADSDCPAAETCTGRSLEIDSFRDTSVSPNVLFVRWGSATPSKPYISYTKTVTNGEDFAPINFKPGSAYWRLRGFTIRATKKEGINVQYNTNNITITDTRVIYNQCGVDCDGGSRNVAYAGSPGFILEDSELSYSADEGLHAVGSPNGVATPIIVRRNWIHDQGNTSVT